MSDHVVEATPACVLHLLDDASRPSDMRIWFTTTSMLAQFTSFDETPVTPNKEMFRGFDDSVK